MNEYITDELIESTYLFCFKRVSDPEAAKDLSQDILCEALRVIASGKSFYHFTSWYWKMARNKYADFVAHKHDAALPIESAGGIVADSRQPIESLINAENIFQLNYSLSRLASMHRQILVRFYLKEQTVKQIAQDLSVPEGTVKRRLYDARKLLKERFDTMTNIGKTSYAPADVHWFWGFNFGKADDVLGSTKICQQIMVICRTEPKTVNDIADEMGIAPVYLEEYIEKMVKVDLLAQNVKGKFVANHCVFPRDQYNEAKRIANRVFHDEGYAEKINQILLSLKDKITSCSFYGNHFDYDYLLWIFYVMAGSAFGVHGRNHYLLKKNLKDEAERAYRLTMQYTLADEPICIDSSYHIRERNWSNLHQDFTTADYGKLEFVNDYEIAPFPDDCDDHDWRQGRDKWVDGNNISLLIALAENPNRKLSVHEEFMVAQLQKHGLIKKDGDKLIVMLPIFDRHVYNQIDSLVSGEIKQLAEKFSEKVSEAVEEILLPYVRKELFSNFVHWDMRIFLQQMGSLFYYGWDQQLAQPEDYSCSAAGLYIIK